MSSCSFVQVSEKGRDWDNQISLSPFWRSKSNLGLGALGRDRPRDISAAFSYLYLFFTKDLELPTHSLLLLYSIKRARENPCSTSSTTRPSLLLSTRKPSIQPSTHFSFFSLWSKEICLTAMHTFFWVQIVLKKCKADDLALTRSIYPVAPSILSPIKRDHFFPSWEDLAIRDFVYDQIHWYIINPHTWWW